jgi:hypothetical protein
MRVPAIEHQAYRELGTEIRHFDPYAVGIVGGGVFLSVAVWALAIAKILDMCGSQ